MLALRDLQKGLRDTLILGETSGLESLLAGGRDPRRRLAIHQRHYSTSLITSLLDRFPAMVSLPARAALSAELSRLSLCGPDLGQGRVSPSSSATMP